MGAGGVRGMSTEDIHAEIKHRKEKMKELNLKLIVRQEWNARIRLLCRELMRRGY